VVGGPDPRTEPGAVVKTSFWLEVRQSLLDFVEDAFVHSVVVRHLSLQIANGMFSLVH